MKAYQEVKIRTVKTKMYKWLKIIKKKTIPKTASHIWVLFSNDKTAQELVKSKDLLHGFTEFFIFQQVKHLFVKMCPSHVSLGGKKYKNTDAEDHEANWVMWPAMSWQTIFLNHLVIVI